MPLHVYINIYILCALHSGVAAISLVFGGGIYAEASDDFATSKAGTRSSLYSAPSYHDQSGLYSDPVPEDYVLMHLEVQNAGLYVETQ